MSSPNRPCRPLPVPGLPPEIRLWHCPVDVEREPPPDVLALLSPAELRRFGRLARREDRARFATTRGALRERLASELLVHPTQVRIREAALGKPELDVPEGELPPIRFSVSHSGRHALLGLSPIGEIGVDIEERRCGRLGPELARFLAPEEAQMLAAGGEQSAADRFLDCWVCKEAVLKAIGVGIGTHLQDFAVLAGPDGQRVIARRSSLLPLEDLAVALVAVDATCSAAVAHGAGQLRLPRRDGPRSP
jgi:4'-phosphopantetheinyl transferase